MINITSAAHRFLAYGAVAALFAVVSIGFGAHSAHAALTRSLDIGDQGSDVSELQAYLSTTVHYPSKLVTGYFGPLTQAGVQRFQASEGIVSIGTPATTGYGRVGPLTLARLNLRMAGGNVIGANAVPIIGTPSVQYGTTSATIGWTTNEPTNGQLYWSTSPIQADEATGPNQMPYISGTLVATTGGAQTNHVVTLSNLQPNTTYYYLIRAIDTDGGITIIWPSQSFRTGI